MPSKKYKPINYHQNPILYTQTNCSFVTHVFEVLNENLCVRFYTESKSLFFQLYITSLLFLFGGVYSYCVFYRLRLAAQEDYDESSESDSEDYQIELHHMLDKLGNYKKYQNKNPSMNQGGEQPYQNYQEDDISVSDEMEDEKKNQWIKIRI